MIVEAWMGNKVLGFTVEQENLIWNSTAAENR